MPNAKVHIHPLLRLVRPLNMVLLFAGAVVGALLAAGLDALQSELLGRVVLAGVSAALVGGAANALNDVYDADIDRINRPERPLPSGRASALQAWLLWGLISLAGIALGATLSVLHGSIAMGAALLLLAYNAYLKRLPLLGNVVVALLAALVLLYGGLAARPTEPAWIGAVFALLTTLAREIIKDVEDVQGDASVQARTLPLIIGAGPASAVACALLLCTVALTPLPYLYAGYGGSYLVLVLGAAAMLFQAAWLLAAPTLGARAAQASSRTKGAMILGLLALTAASIP